MSTVKTVEGQLNANGHRYALVVGRFNAFIVESLQAGAVGTLTQHGCAREDIIVYMVPGAFEIPLVAKKVAESGQVDGVIALGAVIRGSTPHFDYVANEAAKGIAPVSLSTGCPVSFGVLTCDTIEQAIERAGTKAGNKGAEAALAAIEMINVINQIKDGPKP